MTHLEINVQEPYFEHINSGLKTVEGRLAKNKFKNLKEGDKILINNVLEKEVLEVNIYKSFEEMIISEGLENVIPDAKDIAQAVLVYYKFYKKADEVKFGVCAVKFKPDVSN